MSKFGASQNKRFITRCTLSSLRYWDYCNEQYYLVHAGTLHSSGKRVGQFEFYVLLYYSVLWRKFV